MTTTAAHAVERETTQWSLLKLHVQRELWSYLALFGLLYLYLGVIICVYAFKGVFDERVVVALVGVFLVGAGWVHIFFSLVFYRHHRRKQPYTCCGPPKDNDDDDRPEHSKQERIRQSGHSQVGHLTPEFAKYAEFAARDRRYDKRKQHFFKHYDPTQISISFAHRYWMEQQKPLLKTGLGNVALFPSSLPGSPTNNRNDSKKFGSRSLRGIVKSRRQLST